MSNYEFNETKSTTLVKGDAVGALVYVVWLGAVCQYIGTSGRGIERVGESLRSLTNKFLGFDFDRVQLFYQVDAETARVLESDWIERAQPVFNMFGIGNEARSEYRSTHQVQKRGTRDHVVERERMRRGRCDSDKLLRSSASEREAKAHEADDYPFKP
jgi:hypothetical protein